MLVTDLMLPLNLTVTQRWREGEMLMERRGVLVLAYFIPHR